MTIRWLPVVSSLLAVHAILRSDDVDFLKYGSHAYLSKFSANMTVDGALAHMPPLPKEVSSLLNGKLGRKGGAFLQESKKGPAIDTARGMLNKMIEEASSRLDTEMIRCTELQREQQNLIDLARASLAEFNAKAATARGKILLNQNIITDAENEIPKLSSALEAHNLKCKETRDGILLQLTTSKQDQEAMKLMVKSTDCGAGFLQMSCKQQGNQSVVDFKHPTLKRKVSLLSNAVVRQVVQRAMQDMVKVEEDGIPKQVIMNKKKRKVPCSARDIPNCGTLKDKFLLMRGEIDEEVESLENDLETNDEGCKVTKENFEQSIGEYRHTLMVAQTGLADATSEEINANAEAHLLTSQIADLETEMAHIRSDCQTNIQALVLEVCGIKSIRTELYKMVEQSANFQDCELSEWVPGECSVTCEGGTMEMTRSVQVPPNEGAGCLPLSYKAKCNRFPCPIGCVMDDWSGWSACSAKCDGGLQQRVRSITRTPEDGGEPCGSLSESRACGNEACDKDCELTDWTGWSNCSKACDGGSMNRVRNVAVPERGEGACAGEDSELRFQLMTCNMQKCLAKKEVDHLKCHSKLEVIILLDGSGSIEESDWPAVQKAGASLVRAFEAGPELARVAVLVFGGPKDMETYAECMSPKGPEDYAKTCGVKWVGHLTEDSGSLAEKVEQLEQPEGATMTAAALSMAKNELNSARRDVNSIVIAVTDGKPLNKRKTRAAAKQLRKNARLIWVPVGANVPSSQIKRWASRPWKENVLFLKDLAELGKSDTINNIISDVCLDIDGLDVEEMMKPGTFALF